MDKISQPLFPVRQFHSAILESKTDHDLIQIMRKYISSVGGFGNAPIEVFTRLNLT